MQLIETHFDFRATQFFGQHSVIMLATELVAKLLLEVYLVHSKAPLALAFHGDHMKTFVLACAALIMTALFPAGALAMGSSGLTEAQVKAQAEKVEKEEAAREAVIPAAELKAVVDPWNAVSVKRNVGPYETSVATNDLSTKTSKFVTSAQNARINKNRKAFNAARIEANKGIAELCTVYGC